LTKIRQPPAKIKAVLLLITGLAIGVWYSYGITTGSIVAYPQLGLIFDILMLLTFVWMLLWTLTRRAHKPTTRARAVYAAEQDKPVSKPIALHKES
jgi:hypothetical protein